MSFTELAEGIALQHIQAQFMSNTNTCTQFGSRILVIKFYHVSLFCRNRGEEINKIYNIFAFAQIKYTQVIKCRSKSVLEKY